MYVSYSAQPGCVVLQQLLKNIYNLNLIILEQGEDLNLKIINMKLSQQEQKKIFEEHLSQQQKSRQAKLELKKLAEEQKKNPEEHMLYIQKQFKSKSENIDNAIKKYKEKAITFNELMSEYSLTKDYYVNMCYALKTYDRQSYKQALDKMYNTIIDLKKKHEPRKKFKFSRREEDFGVKTAVNEQNIITKQRQENNIPGIQGKSNQTITIHDPHSKIGSYKIVSCSNTTITILDKTEILFLKNLQNCTIRAALTKSTVFVDHCKNCVFELSCHQLRIHNTYHTTFKIFVTSKAIIEDCDKVIFSPYSFAYENRLKDEEEFDRQNKENLWREIQDFNWLKENQKSPHYDLVQ